MAPDYHYDVYLSYKKDKIIVDWVVKFKDHFSQWLSQELGFEARIFFDQESVDTGAKWPGELERAIKHSKCILCIWSPLYFKSDWCLSEWLSFEEREKMLKLSGESVILPVRFHDGENYPKEAQERQSSDFREYSSAMEAFWRSEKGYEFEGKIKQLAKSCANMVNNAPNFRDDFPIVQGKNKQDKTGQELIRF